MKNKNSAVNHRPNARTIHITKYMDGKFEETEDSISWEEPLEIRICNSNSGTCTQFAVTMRTPGEDEDLAAGLLLTEGILKNPLDFKTEKTGKVESNVIEVWLADYSGEMDLKRQIPSYSSCGLCGKTSIDQVFVKGARIQHTFRAIRPEIILSLPEKMHLHQKMFSETGGLHGAALFTSDGAILAWAEDIGRHNAVDKVLGRSFIQGYLEKGKILQISGRAGFEIVQKAAIAGIPILSSVSAPSSLAVETAEAFGITLLCFVRGNRFNIYTHGSRITGQLMAEHRDKF